MDHYLMIEKMKNAGIHFEPGLSNEEFDKIESVFGFRFPIEIRDFLACGLPVGVHFFNWRDTSEANLQQFKKFSASVDQSFQFDLEHNWGSMRAMLREPFPDLENQEEFANAVMDFLHRSTKLIPFYAHRCFFDGMDHMPIVSFWQPTDTIFYGADFEDYLEREFLGKRGRFYIPEQMENTGIWRYVVE